MEVYFLSFLLPLPLPLLVLLLPFIPLPHLPLSPPLIITHPLLHQVPLHPLLPLHPSHQKFLLKRRVVKKEREKNGMEEKCMCVHQRCVEVVYGVVVEV